MSVSVINKANPKARWVKVVATATAKSASVMIGKAKPTGKIQLLLSGSLTQGVALDLNTALVVQSYDRSMLKMGMVEPTTYSDVGVKGQTYMAMMNGNGAYTELFSGPGTMNSLSVYNFTNRTMTAYIEIM